ncbi:hypothetical protein ACWC0C_25665 [Streptomyces sp. NPDC001709]
MLLDDDPREPMGRNPRHPLSWTAREHPSEVVAVGRRITAELMITSPVALCPGRTASCGWSMRNLDRPRRRIRLAPAD